MAIQLLDEQLINKIAAGEVVERPASVVKELVENSLDAGARRIQVQIAGGGMESIEVVDDGEGILEEDLPLALMRHATSKISREADLDHIKTMGFRGEALPSIASVSRLEIFTRHTPESGVLARWEGGQLREQSPLAGQQGTRIIIKDLFYNTPARRKFLRTAVTEGNHVYDLICRYAMARPEVSFTFSNNRRRFFKTPGSGRLDEVIISLWGTDILSHLLVVDSSQGCYSLNGYVSGIELHRFNRKNQIFFVNHRPVRSPLLYRALDTAYKGMLLAREQPLAILNLMLPEEEVDVNVHPQKTEVRFRDDRKIFQTLVEGLNQVLDGTVPRADSLPSMIWSPAGQSMAEPAESGEETRTRPSYRQDGIPFAWNAGPAIREIPDEKGYTVIPEDPAAHRSDSAEARIVGQVLNTYIVLEKDDALWLVDQHAAHERIMYEKFKARSSQPPLSQVLAIPLALEFSGRQMDTIETHREEIEKLGFVLDPLGPNSMLIRQTPALARGREIEVLLELVEMIEVEPVKIGEKAMIMMACKRAVKAGCALQRLEMEELIGELFTVPDYLYCPHGRPTMIKLSRSDLDRMFKR